MAIIYQLALLSIIVSSSVVLSASLPLLHASDNSDNRGASNTVSSKRFIVPYDPMDTSSPHLQTPEGPTDAMTADALTSLLTDSAVNMPPQLQLYPSDDASLFLQQLSTAASRTRGKRSGMSDQKLAEIETLLALRAFKLLQDHNRIAYGVIDPDKM